MKSSQYNEGYEAAMRKMLEGLEKGIKISDNQSEGGNSKQSNLPQIPWDIDQDKKDSKEEKGKSEKEKSGNPSGSQSKEDKAKDAAEQAKDAAKQAKDAADKAQEAADKANKSSSSSQSSSGQMSQKEKDNINKAAEKAKEAAEKAQEAADKAQEAADKGDADAAEKAAKEASKAMQDAVDSANEASDKSADEYAKDAEKYAKEAAEQAKEAAENAKSSGTEEAKKAAEKAKEAADKAQKNADEAKKAAESGNTEAAKKAAKDALSNREMSKSWNSASKNSGDVDSPEDILDKAEQNSKDYEAKPPRAGGNLENTDDVDIDGLTDMVKKLRDKYVKDAISSPMGDALKRFIEKLKSSEKLEEGGLISKFNSGSSSWQKIVPNLIKRYVTQKIQKRQRFRRSYSRMNRRQGAINFDNGPVILKKGKIKEKDQISFEISLYIDVSGSMDHIIHKLFIEVYKEIDKILSIWGRDKNIDKVNVKTYMFGNAIAEIPYGTVPSDSTMSNKAGKGNCDFDQLIGGIKEKNSTSFANIIFTDGGYNINVNKTASILNSIEGLTVFIVNNKDNEDDLNALEKAVQNNKFKPVYVDYQFSLGDLGK